MHILLNVLEPVLALIPTVMYLLQFFSSIFLLLPTSNVGPFSCPVCICISNTIFFLVCVCWHLWCH